MKFILIGKIEDLDKEFQVHYNQFSSETKQTAKKYEQMLEQNKILSTEIANTTRAIERFRNTKIYWQLKIESNDREFTQRNSELNTEKMKIYNHYKKLKQNMTKQRDEKERHIGMLAMNSLKCMQTLKEYQKLGEKILKTAELCRKLETEKEKVLPFYQTDPDSMVESELQVEKIVGIEKGAYNEFKQLDNFYKRYNKVHLDKLAIEKQKATLEKENLFFKNLLKQYLDGVSINDDVLNANNPLLVVNNKVNLNRPPVIEET